MGFGTTEVAFNVGFPTLAKLGLNLDIVFYKWMAFKWSLRLWTFLDIELYD